MPSSTLAWIGLSFGSNASSVMEKLVRRTGTTRDLPHTRKVRGRSAGQIWAPSRLGQGADDLDRVLGG